MANSKSMRRMSTVCAGGSGTVKAPGMSKKKQWPRKEKEKRLRRKGLLPKADKTPRRKRRQLAATAGRSTDNSYRKSY